MRFWGTIVLLFAAAASAATITPQIGGGISQFDGGISATASGSPTVDANFASNSIAGCASFAACLTTTRAQAEVCTDASGNLTSVAANTPCITSAGLQVYGAATNMITQSNTFSTWTKTVAGDTLTANNVAAPDGTTTAATLTDSASSGLHRLVSPNVTFTNGVTYARSVYLQDGSPGIHYVQLYDNATGAFGGVGSTSPPFINIELAAGQGQTACSLVSGDPSILPGATATALPNGWCRVCYVTTAIGTVTNIGLIVSMIQTPTSARAVAYTGAGSSLNIWGAQVEANSICTPIIATAGATASRAADQIVAAGVLQTCLQSAAVRVVMNVGGSVVNLGQGAGYPATALGFNTLGAGLQIVAGNLLQTGWGSGTKATANQAANYTSNNIGFSADGTGRAVALNGYTVASDANAPTAATAENIGSLSDGTASINGNISRIRCWNTRNDTNMKTATNNAGYVAPVASYTGAVSNGTNEAQSISAATSCAASTVCTQFQTRSVIKFTENGNQVSVVLANYYVGSATLGVETGSGTAGTISAQIEYPAGNCNRLTFSASNTTTIPNGGKVTSDVLTLPYVSGTYGFVRVFGTGFTTGIVGDFNSILSAPTTDTVNGEAMQTANIGMTEIPCGSTVTNTTANWMYRPIAIVGPTINRTICDIGDSIALGVLDTILSDKNDYGGVVERPLGQQIPLGFISIASGGDRANYFISNHTNRGALFPYCTQAVIEFGVNDLIGGARTPAQLSADMTTLAGQFTAGSVGGVGKVWQTTITPDTTSTDSFVTTVNQTGVAGNSNIPIYNDLVRAGISGYSGYFDIANALMSGVDSGLWAVNGFASFCTIVGLHPQSTCYMQAMNSGVFNPAVIHQ